jgi:hypothetical protein
MTIVPYSTLFERLATKETADKCESSKNPPIHPPLCNISNPFIVFFSS